MMGNEYVTIPDTFPLRKENLGIGGALTISKIEPKAPEPVGSVKKSGGKLRSPATTLIPGFFNTVRLK